MPNTLTCFYDIHHVIFMKEFVINFCHELQLNGRRNWKVVRALQKSGTNDVATGKIPFSFSPGCPLPSAPSEEGILNRILKGTESEGNVGRVDNIESLQVNKCQISRSTESLTLSFPYPFDPCGQ